MSHHPAGSFQGFSKPTPTSQVADFFGHGLSFETVPAVASSEVEQLRRECEQLRQQLQHQQELLLIWQQQPCTLCQLHSTHASSSSSSSITGSTSGKIGSTPNRHISSSASASSRSVAQLRQQDSPACRKDSSSEAADGGSCCQAVQCRLDRALRQQHVQLAQMQKQVLVLQAELSSREQLVLEADTVLAEAARRLAGLAATAAAAPALGSGSGTTRTPQRQSVATATGSSSSSRRVSGAAVRTPGSSSSSSSGGGTGTPSAAGVVAVADQVVEQAQGVAMWCRTAASRISRVRAASVAQCCAARQASSCWGSGSGSSSSRGTAGGRGGWDAGDGGDAAEGVVSRLQQLQLQYVPAGGNKYLANSPNFPLTSLAEGQGLSLIHLPALQSLMQLLGGLALPLADLAVQLRSIVLPALPWLGSTAGSMGQALPESCADLAHSAAAAAAEIVELCSVLPAVPSWLSSAATAAASKAGAARAAALQQARQWGSTSSSSSSSTLRATEAAETGEEAGAASRSGSTVGMRPKSASGSLNKQQAPLELDLADQQLLSDVAVLLLPAASQQSGSNLRSRDQHSSSRSSGGGGEGAVAGAGASPQRNASSSNTVTQQKRQQQGEVLLQQLTQRWRVLWFKRCVLEEQLGFVARCSAEQAKLVSGLVQRVATAAANAADEFETTGELQQRRDGAEQLARQLLRALLLLEQQGGSGSALRALAGVLQQHRDAIEDLPQLLQGSSADAVKSAVLAAVAGAFEDFCCELQLAQQSCKTAVASASAAAQV